MLGRYTTGLQPVPSKHGFYIITLALRHAPLFLESFSDAVAFLDNGGPIVTTPQCVHYGVFVLGVAR